jgi:glycosyltransferase involved in cell wall biosynthesis
LGVPPDLISIIPPGIFALERPIGTLDSNRIPVIGSAAYSVESSGLHIFFEAARTVLAANRDAEFMVALQGGDDLDIRRLAQQLGISDRVTIADYPLVGSRFWTVLDAYCQPSLARSAGRLLAQAMANEIPCIISDVPGLRDLVQDRQTGLIVPGGEPQPLAEAILSLLDDRGAAHSLARSAAEFVRDHFDPESEANRLHAIFQKITDTHP